jgi:anaerobic selenocysteine-containing dehydrogenase
MAFILGGNLYDSNPDSKYAEKSLNKIPFKIFLNTTLNHGHFHGVDEEVLILPVAARDEEKQATTQESMFNFVRMSDGGIVRLDNVHSEVDIISQIADEVLGKDIIDFEQFKKYNNLRKAIGITIPGFDKIADIDEAKTEFQIEGRTLAQKEFPTIDKKATFKVCPIPELKGAEGDFRMMSIRSEGQYNSIIYEEEDLYRNQSSRWVVLMNKEDLFQKGLKENDLVTLESSVGKMKHVKVRVFDIPSGNVMTYYPESNVLVSNATDPRSKTPGFKLTLVKMVLEK